MLECERKGVKEQQRLCHGCRPPIRACPRLQHAKANAGSRAFCTARELLAFAANNPLALRSLACLIWRCLPRAVSFPRYHLFTFSLSLPHALHNNTNTSPTTDNWRRAQHIVRQSETCRDRDETTAEGPFPALRRFSGIRTLGLPEAVRQSSPQPSY